MHAVVYAAKSTEDTHGSIKTQLEGCLAAIKREGRTIYGAPQIDEGFSAFKGNRGPGLAEAKRLAVEAATIYGTAELWVEHSDRLARGDGLTADHLGEIYFEMRRQHVRLRSVQDDSNLEDVIRAVLIGERNTEDSRRKSLAVKNGMKRRADRGKPNGGPPSYGYQWVEDEAAPVHPGRRRPSKLVPSPGEVEIVRRIFGDFAAGKSQKQIVRDLDHAGVRTRFGKRWHQGSISVILSNPVYIGRNRFNGDEPEGEHEPIIDAALWQKVAQLRAATARTTGQGRGRPSSGSHLFGKGVLRCGECGNAMVPRTIKPRSKTGRPYEAYLCYGRIRDKDSCSQGPVMRALVDSGVERHLLDIGIDIDATQAEIAEQIDGALRRAEVLLLDAERDAARAEDRLSRVRRDYQDGRLDADDWREQRVDLASQRQAARANVERLRVQSDEAASQSLLRDAEVETLRYMAAIREAIVGEIRESGGVEALRSVLVRLFSHFTLHRLDSESLPEHPALYADLLLVGGYVVEPHVRPEVVESFECDGLVPVLRREPLYRAENKDGMGRAR